MFSWSIIALQYCLKFLLYNKVVQLYVCIYLLPLNPPCLPSPSHLSRSSQSTELCSPCIQQLCTGDSVCMPMLVSQFIPPSPSPTVSTLEKMFLTVYSWVSWGAKERKCLPSVPSLSSCRILSLGKCNCLLLSSLKFCPFPFSWEAQPETRTSGHVSGTRAFKAPHCGHGYRLLS